MTFSEYDHLKQQIVIGVGSSERHNQLLRTLKDFFRKDINSTRRFEQINSIGELLALLELRDVLSEDNIEPLKEIALRLSNSNVLMRKIAEYEVSHVPREYANYYISENTQNTINRETESIINTHPNAGLMTKRKKQRINDTIIEHIGTFWTDLARNLKIQESAIDEIELQNTSLASKANKILEIYYEKKSDPNRWFFNLCEALEKARRKDLSRDLQEIITMNM